MKILALLDGRPGNDNQTLAIAEKLGEFESVKIEFSKAARLPNCILGTSNKGIKTDISKYNPEIVIASGRKLARVSRIIKKNTGCILIHLMWPGTDNEDFNLIFVPMHDKIKNREGVIRIVGAPNRIDEELLAKYATPLSIMGRVAMLVGDISPSDIPKNISAKKLHITTSRRTKPKTLAALKELNPASIYDWASGEENPYYSLLSTAEKIIVSADSVGMISEACTTGKPVYIFGKPKKSKFKKFIRYLYDNNYAKPISQFEENWQPAKLSTRDDIINVLKG